MKMKKMLAMVLAGVMAMSFAAVPVMAGEGESYDPIEFIYSANRNENADKATLEYLDAITEASGGAITFDKNLNSSIISNAADIPESLAAGIADISLLNVNNFPGMLPWLNTLATMPMMTYSPEARMHVYDDFFAEHPEFDEELAAVGLKRLGWTIATPEGLCVKLGKAYTSIEDLKGVKIWGSSEVVSKMLLDAGAIPTSIAFTDAYTSLEKNVINGVVNAPAAVFNMSWSECCDNWVQLNTTTGLSFIVMSLDKWNSIPENVQALFEQFEYARRESESGIQDFSLNALCASYEENGKFVVSELSDEQKAEWEAIAAPYIESAIETAEAARAGFGEVYEALLQKIAEY